MWYHHQERLGMDGWGVLALVFWLVVTIDLALVGMWLWQRIQKHK